jgi:DNA-binding NarL/FixJ family response regulator
MQQTQQMINVLLADDHSMLRQGLRTLLEASGRIKVVGEAANGQEAINLALTLNPDIVVMDLAMPGVNGSEATRQIKRLKPCVKVLVLSMHQSKEYVIELLRAGASGYLIKDASADELLHAILTVASGEVYLYPSVATQLVDDLVNLAAGQAGRAVLTARERELLQCIACGMSNRDIALRMGIALNTVRSHRASLMQKLGAHDGAELIREAIHRGLIPA